MTHLRSRAALNRALFDLGPLDSAALAVRGWILHRFDAPGRYRVAVRRNGLTRGSISVDVNDAHPARQIDIDLSRWDDDGATGDRSGERARQLAPNGMMIFQPTRGFATYSVRVDRADVDRPEVVFDSRQGLPAGDLFGAILALPGTYRIVVNDAPLAIVHVRTPDPADSPRTGRPFLLHTGETPPRLPVRHVEIGSTVVVFLEAGGQVLVQTLSATSRPKPPANPRMPEIDQPNLRPDRSRT